MGTQNRHIAPRLESVSHKKRKRKSMSDNKKTAIISKGNSNIYVGKKIMPSGP